MEKRYLNLFPEKIIWMIAILIVSSCKSTSNNHITTLNIGIQNSPSNSLIIIAANKFFFDTTRVKVNIKEFTAGKLALQSLLGQANDLDLAVSAETPIVLSSLSGNKVKIISQIVSAKNECRVVARIDGDLNTPEKYFSKPRKLTTSLGGSPEWFTYNFIKQYHLDKNKVQIIAMLPENMPVALSGGAVDAISIFDPFARIGEIQLGINGQTFLNKNVTSYYVMSVKENTVIQKNEALKELIKGLRKAEAFIVNNPGEAKKIVAQQTKIDIEIVNKTWANYSFKVGLGKDLIALCVAESNWAIESGKYPRGTLIPDFKSITYNGLLK